MKTININGVSYEIIKDYNDAINEEEITLKLTEYFDNFDYIVGDWSYGKLRLKGFYNDENKQSNSFNIISNLEEYLQKYCSYGCKYFVLRKQK